MNNSDLFEKHKMILNSTDSVDLFEKHKDVNDETESYNVSTLNLYANPEDINMIGFIFTDLKEYNDKYLSNYEINLTEKYEISFIDGNTDQKIFAKLYPLKNFETDMYRLFRDLNTWENLTAIQRAAILYMRYLGYREMGYQSFFDNVQDDLTKINNSIGDN